MFFFRGRRLISIVGVNYRKLNSKTYKQRIPISLIGDIIDQLHSSKVFTTFGLKNIYLHVEVDREIVEQIHTIFTHSGQVKFLFMNYSLPDSRLVFKAIFIMFLTTSLMVKYL